MKRLIFSLILGLLVFSLPCAAQNFSATQVLNQVYGSLSTACTVDIDADTGEHNRLAVAAKRRYALYCFDGVPGTGTGVGLACACLQGTSTVDASVGGTNPGTAFLLTAGEKVIVLQKVGNTHISCNPYADDTFVAICPLD